MPRLIDANALRDRFKLRLDWLKLDVHDEYTKGLYHGCDYDMTLINELPTVEVEVVHSGWILNDDGSGTCKHCHITTKNCWDYDSWMNYCPNCGADMRERRSNGGCNNSV